MLERRKLWMLLLLGLATAALILLSTALTGLELLPGQAALSMAIHGEALQMTPYPADFCRFLIQAMCLSDLQLESWLAR